MKIYVHAISILVKTYSGMLVSFCYTVFHRQGNSMPTQAIPYPTHMPWPSYNVNNFSSVLISHLLQDKIFKKYSHLE